MYTHPGSMRQIARVCVLGSLLETMEYMHMCSHLKHEKDFRKEKELHPMNQSRCEETHKNQEEFARHRYTDTHQDLRRRERPAYRGQTNVRETHSHQEVCTQQNTAT